MRLVITLIGMPNYRSGTEEEYCELTQLLEDISTYMRDFEEVKERDKNVKKKKEAEDKSKAEEIRRAAMEGMASTFGHCNAFSVL